MNINVHDMWAWISGPDKVPLTGSSVRWSPRAPLSGRLGCVHVVALISRSVSCVRQRASVECSKPIAAPAVSSAPRGVDLSPKSNPFGLQPPLREGAFNG